MQRTPMDNFDCDGEEEADLLFVAAAAEAESLRRISKGGGRDSRNTKQESESVEPAESVSSSFHSPRNTLRVRDGHGFDDKETSSKRSKLEPEGEYMAALRGTHSETWQAVSSKVRTDLKPSYNATSSSASAITGFDNGGSQGGGSRACFHCGKEGHWARDCPTKSINPSSWRHDSTNIPAGQAQVPEKDCPCGGGLCKVLTANTEKNAGRQFYRCPLRKEEGQCGFFEWCDNNTSTSYGLSKEHSDGQTQLEFSCPCGAGLCITLTAKTEKNMGRQFYRCPLNQGEGSCGFFKWCDEALPTSSTAPAYGRSPFKERMPMPNVATGQCYKCGMDGHWAKDCSFAAQNSAQKGIANTMRSSQVGGGTTGTCYKCGQVGHWARDCPNQQSGLGNKGAAGFNRYGSEANVSQGFPNAIGHGSAEAASRDIGAFGSAGSGVCFKCGSQGHWLKDCPNVRPSSYGGGQTQGSLSGRSTGGSGSCYKCGGQGHWANECRSDGKGRSMY